MSKKNDPAFPSGETWMDYRGNSNSHGPLYKGMSKLEWFAGRATENDILDFTFDKEGNVSRTRAEARFAFAEAMIVESEKRK